MIPVKCKESRSKGLAKIHIAKKSLCLTEEAYQDILYNIAGVKSAKCLDKNGIADVLNYMRKCGFKPVHRSAKSSGMHVKPAEEKEAHLSKIASLLTELEKPWDYVDAISRHAFKVDSVRWLTTAQLGKLIGILLRNQKNLRRRM